MSENSLPPVPAGADIDIASLRALAERLATTAGALVRDGRPATVEVAATKSTGTDPVTEMDRASEDLLRGILAEERPDDAILGEEGDDVAGTSGLTWVVDPIDGTVNYLYGVAGWAVSVAVVAGPPDPAAWTILAGAVHSVPQDTTWSAGLGQGATRDGEPIGVSRPASLGECLVGTGFGYDADRRAAQAVVLTHVLPQVRDIRRLGSAAIDLCLLAQGSIDLYYERGLNPWDMAAGALVATEAGAVMTGLRGRVATGDMVVAGGADFVAPLAKILEAANADEG
ncbi:inositol monophosphatase family protein [Myceligenerans salitolerans]|uniref:inositol monophosphatase family protein n=1 Tax=Myceligenerans salitolerans TaxID=1230528 RepID=UPI0027DC9F43|nr:inositol monophosphatase family protein [Myceligenerans salitolerans]